MPSHPRHSAAIRPGSFRMSVHGHGPAAALALDLQQSRVTTSVAGSVEVWSAIADAGEVDAMYGDR